MLLRCISVVRFPQREYSRDHFYAPAEFVAMPDTENEWEWALLRFLGPVLESRIRAFSYAWAEACGHSLPYYHSAEHGEAVNLDCYRIACNTQNLPCPFPDPIAPAADDTIGKGA